MTFDSDQPEHADRIFVRDHTVELEIGAFGSERDTKQRVSFTIVVDVENSVGLSDDVDRVMSYDTILEAIQIESELTRYDLLETLAENIATRILMDPISKRVSVRIDKLDRVDGALGVEVVRSERGVETEKPKAPEWGISVFCLPANAQDWAADWIESLETPPLVICIDPGKSDLPENPTAARRLMGLAADKAAWELFAELDKYNVVSSRTELKHALALHLPIIWSPGKMMIDSGESSPAPAGEFDQLARWFSKQIGATDLRFVSLAEADGSAFIESIEEIQKG